MYEIHQQMLVFIYEYVSPVVLFELENVGVQAVQYMPR
jgi:hypothetical protein